MPRTGDSAGILFKATWGRRMERYFWSVSVRRWEPTAIYRDKDVDRMDPIDLDKTYVPRDLINILRARTFSPYPGAYFLHEGRKIYLSLQLDYEVEQK